MLWTVDCQAPLSMEFSRQEYRKGLSFPSPADLPNLGCGGGGAPRDSAGSGATEEGLTSRGGRNLRLPLRVMFVDGVIGGRMNG